MWQYRTDLQISRRNCSHFNNFLRYVHVSCQDWSLNDSFNLKFIFLILCFDSELAFQYFSSELCSAFVYYAYKVESLYDIISLAIISEKLVYKSCTFASILFYSSCINFFSLLIPFPPRLRKFRVKGKMRRIAQSKSCVIGFVLVEILSGGEWRSINGSTNF